MKSCVHFVMMSTNFSVTRTASYCATIACPGSSSLGTMVDAWGVIVSEKWVGGNRPYHATLRCYWEDCGYADQLVSNKQISQIPEYEKEHVMARRKKRAAARLPFAEELTHNERLNLLGDYFVNATCRLIGGKKPKNHMIIGDIHHDGLDALLEAKAVGSPSDLRIFVNQLERIIELANGFPGYSHATMRSGSTRTGGAYGTESGTARREDRYICGRSGRKHRPRQI